MWNFKKGNERIYVKDLGYRNFSYCLEINGKIFRFPTGNEAYEYYEELVQDAELEDSGE